MGVYKTLTDVPERRRFRQFEAVYEGRDVWGEYCDEDLFDRLKSENSRKPARRTERRWKAHMDERGRHHALATPDDVEAWFADILESGKFSLEMVYANQYLRVENFYTWLQNHTEHPHVYHPVWMAAADPATCPNTARMWEYKIGRTRHENETWGEGQ